jgi:hypothetical protein
VPQQISAIPIFCAQPGYLSTLATMTDPSSAAMSQRGRRADLVLRVGVGVTALGLLFTVIALIPLAIPSWNPPGWLWFAAMVVGVGLFIMIVGLVLSARGRRRRS